MTRTTGTAAEHTCARCCIVLPSPHDGEPPKTCLPELGGCGRTIVFCAHDLEIDGPVETCDTCRLGYTRFLPGRLSPEHVALLLDAENDPYNRLIEGYKTYFRTEDTAPLDVCLSAVGTSSWDGDPLWAYIVGAPSSGKTEVLRAFDGLDSTFYLSSLSPNSLISGLKDGKDLLPDLNKRTLIVKDLTMTLEMHRENRDALFGALRDAFDGSFAKAFGTVGTKRYDSQFNMLAAVTSAIEEYYTVAAVLGQRFVMVRTTFPKDFEADDQRDIEGMRAALKTMASALFASRPVKAKPPTMPEVCVNECKELAAEVALLRTHVHRDGYSHEIASIPEPEAPARLTNQFIKLARGLAWVRSKSEVTDDEMKVVRRVAHDTIPSVRSKIIEAVNAGAPTIDAISITTGLPRRTIERKVEDMVMLGALNEDSSGKPYAYTVPRPSLRFNISTDPSGGIA